MRFILPVYSLVLVFLFSACEEQVENPNIDLEQDYQPLEIGNFWIYDVEETIFFGENDFEESEFFYRDRIRTSFRNAENEIVYIVQRAKSSNKIDWTVEIEYTLQYRDQILIRIINNSPLAALTFPPKIGTRWNGRIYQAEGNDDFEIAQIGTSELTGFEGVSSVRVNQEDLDDEITIRDIRYEIFGKGIGLLEKYDEVVTYCSRNDCLGQQLINSGSKTYLKLVEYGTN